MFLVRIAVLRVLRIVNLVDNLCELLILLLGAQVNELDLGRPEKSILALDSEETGDQLLRVFQVADELRHLGVLGRGERGVDKEILVLVGMKLNIEGLAEGRGPLFFAGDISGELVGVYRQFASFRLLFSRGCGTFRCSRSFSRDRGWRFGYDDLRGRFGLGRVFGGASTAGAAGSFRDFGLEYPGASVAYVAERIAGALVILVDQESIFQVEGGVAAKLVLAAPERELKVSVRISRGTLPARLQYCSRTLSLLTGLPFWAVNEL